MKYTLSKHLKSNNSYPYELIIQMKKLHESINYVGEIEDLLPILGVKLKKSTIFYQK